MSNKNWSKFVSGDVSKGTAGNKALLLRTGNLPTISGSNQDEGLIRLIKEQLQELKDMELQMLERKNLQSMEQEFLLELMPFRIYQGSK